MPGFDIQELFLRFRLPLLILLAGLILILGGVFVYRSGVLEPQTKIEVINTSKDSGGENGQTTVEIAGEVEKPGVYKMKVGDRVEDILVVAGGFSVNADRTWTDKYLNKASKLTDGQKIFIPSIQQSNTTTASNVLGDQTVSSSNNVTRIILVNINTATLSELDSLPGIGQVYGQNIIDHRPYSDASELLSKGVLKQSVYNKIKDKISVY